MFVTRAVSPNGGRFLKATTVGPRLVVLIVTCFSALVTGRAITLELDLGLRPGTGSHLAMSANPGGSFGDSQRCRPIQPLLSGVR